MSYSVEVLTQQFLESITTLTAVIPAAHICSMSMDRELDLALGGVVIYRETGHIPQISLSGYTGLSQHKFTVVIMSHDPDEASRAMSGLKARFREVASWPYKPSGWIAGDRYLEGGELNEGSTDQTPEIVSDVNLVQKNLTIDLWYQE